ncbi:hypothetical protein C1Y63_00125 [Corynebacterium sp. 13CS0277]|uniref:hypothetical protein n=1 Tax=Corynebacterium sp. 13CS0277 TaxID=2071994 RepID=UPI000D042E40|nr:hypothetical protein [Corynebacterium sp. 13CS0277]PRQ12508.1 hypothetical protein C1Y63_00125 [Corynebacterium sp. 13CS0277]
MSPATPVAPAAPRGRRPRADHARRQLARELLRVGLVLMLAYLGVGGVWGALVPSLHSDGTFVAYPDTGWPDVDAWFAFVIATGLVGIISGVAVGTRPAFATNPVSVFLMGAYTFGCTAVAWLAGEQVALWRYPTPEDGAGEISALLFVNPGMAYAFAPAMACLSMWIYLALRYIQVGTDEDLNAQT